MVMLVPTKLQQTLDLRVKYLNLTMSARPLTPFSLLMSALEDC